MLVVLLVNNTPGLARWTGIFAGGLVAIYITFEAPLSGMLVLIPISNQLSPQIERRNAIG